MTAVNLPDQIWGRLATVADDRGVTVSALLVAAVQEVVKPRNRRERILTCIRAGYTDARTAEATGELKNYVGDVRRSVGLPANRPGQEKSNDMKTPNPENRLAPGDNPYRKDASGHLSRVARDIGATQRSEHDFNVATARPLAPEHDRKDAS